MAQKRLMKPLGTNLLGLGLLVVVIASVLVLIGMWPLVSPVAPASGRWRSSTGGGSCLRRRSR